MKALLRMVFLGIKSYNGDKYDHNDDINIFDDYNKKDNNDNHEITIILIIMIIIIRLMII